MSGKAAVSIFVLIDALGWRLLEGREFLSSILPYRVRLRTVLGYSSAAIPTILTGRSPAEHGHWNLVYYDPNHSPFRLLRFLSVLPETLVNRRVIRKMIKELGRRVLGLGTQFECCVSPRVLGHFNWVEKKNIYGYEGIDGSSSIFDQLKKAGIPHRIYSFHTAGDEQIFELAKKDIMNRKAEFYFLYLSELDHFLHHHRDNEEQVAKRLDWYEGNLRELFLCAKKMNDEVRFTVFSDHGMTPVGHRYDLKGEVEALGFTMPTDYLAVYDSTMARFWFFSERARHAIVPYLETLNCARIVSNDELRTLGVLFTDRRYGDTIVLLNPGWLIAHGNFNGRGWMPVGMHGYHPDDPESDAMFLSNQEPKVPVRTIADIHECMRNALG